MIIRINKKYVARARTICWTVQIGGQLAKQSSNRVEFMGCPSTNDTVLLQKKRRQTILNYLDKNVTFSIYATLKSFFFLLGTSNVSVGVLFWEWTLLFKKGCGKNKEQGGWSEFRNSDQWYEWSTCTSVWYSTEKKE